MNEGTAKLFTPVNVPNLSNLPEAHTNPAVGQIVSEGVQVTDMQAKLVKTEWERDFYKNRYLAEKGDEACNREYVHQAEIKVYREKIDELGETIKKLSEHVVTQNLEIAGLKSDVSAKDEKIADLEIKLVNSQDESVELRKELALLKEEKTNKRRGRKKETFDKFINDSLNGDVIKQILKETIGGKRNEDAFIVIETAVKLKWFKSHPAHPVILEEFGDLFSAASYSDYKNTIVPKDKINAIKDILEKKFTETRKE